MTPVGDSTQLPPVFVMNPFYTGIGIARSLRDSPVRVYGLASAADAPGLHSRFFERVYRVPDGRDEPEALCHRLLELRRLHADAPVIFPTRDFDVLFLHANQDRLAPWYRIPQLAGPAILGLLDKLELARLAFDCGIPAPTTLSCRSDRDCEEASGALRFPVVLKPRHAYEWRQKGIWERLRGRKAIVAATPADLRQEYRDLAALTGAEVLVQEYVAGDDRDIVVCGCYVDGRGALRAHFTARKSLQSPPLFGTGCLVETADIPDIVSLSVALLKAAGYTGIAEIEFKHDRERDRFVLIEVNPRHWDQHELGLRVGVNVTWAAYHGVLGRSIPAQVPTYQRHRPGRWIAERELFLLLARQAYRAAQEPARARVPALGRTAVNLLHSVTEMRARLRLSENVYGVLHPRDPLPGTLMVLRMLRDLATASVAATLRRRAAPTPPAAQAVSHVPTPHGLPRTR